MITVDFNRLPAAGSHPSGGYRILDAGCGTGRHACAAYRLPSVTVVAADLSLEDVSEAANRLRFHDRVGEHGGGTWGVNVADIRHLPFADAAFDLVICSEVLEHIADHRSALGELMRVLKPGGDLVVSVPRYFPERICWALSADYHRTRGGHIRIYTKTQLLGLVGGAGARVWKIRFAHSLHTPYWWLKCLVGPDREDHRPINLYHRFLTWDIMKKPRLTRFVDGLLNPLLGKSIVVYAKKPLIVNR